MGQDTCLVIYVTAPVDQARELARTVVEQGLAACVNILPAVRSIYRWQVEICEDEEALMIIKTRERTFEALRRAIVEAHRYDVPEVIAVPVVAGHAPYLDWVRKNTDR